jgi:uncharacterized protein (TIGR03663 family)
MHCDEAVQADKFGTLLEKGSYEYSPEEFHGPTLNYLTLLPAWLQGISHYADVSEITLRSVPAFFGVLLVASHFLIAPQLGIRAAITSALLAAVSPAMVFYSRYYIHEAILVFFSFTAILSICRYLKTPHAGWAVNAGVSLGLMHATKETCVIAFASMALAWLFTWIIEKLQDRSQKPQISPQSHSAARDQDSGIREFGSNPRVIILTEAKDLYNQRDSSLRSTQDDTLFSGPSLACRNGLFAQRLAVS